MKPRFGVITQVIAGVFCVAGIGAGFATFGSSTMPEALILVSLALVCLAVGAGIWVEVAWAWWIGAAMTLATVVMALALRIGWDLGFVWPAVLAAFSVSGLQGWRDRSPAG